MELSEFVKEALGQIGRGLQEYRNGGGLALLFPDAVAFEVYMRGTKVGQPSIVGMQADARLMFTVQVDVPFPESER